MKRIPSNVWRNALSRSALALLICGVSSLHAQEEDSDEVVMLSPFTVDESGAVGYHTPNSLSGARISMPLANMPMTLNVITEQFIDDVAAFDLQESLRYTAGVTTSGDTGTTIRGFPALWNQRNGFRRYDYGDAANIQRVEVIKGPAGVLYGLSRPGGITNYITKRPVNGSSFTEIKQFLGTNDFRRTEIDANFGDREKVAFRITGSFTDNESDLTNDSREILFFNPSLRWNLGPETTLVVEAEFLERDQVNQPGRYYDRSKIGSSSNGWLDEIYSFVDIDTRYVDGREIKSNRADTFALELNHRISESLYMRLGSYFIDRADRETSTNRRGFATTFGALRDSEGNLVLDGQGNEIPAIGRHWASDNSLNRWQSHQLEFDYEWRVGEFESNFLLGMYISKDINDRLLYEDRDFILIEDTSNPGTAPAGFRSAPVGGPGSGRPLGWLGSARKLRWNSLENPGDLSINDARWDPVNFQFPWLEYQDNIENDAIYLNWLGKMSGGRMHTLVGLRYDESSKDRFSTGAVGSEAPWADDYLAPQAGAMFKVTPGISLYGFYSESFDPQNGRSNSFNVQFDPLVGEQLEVGLKGDWLDGGLVGTLSLFEVTETNRVFFDPDAPNAGGGLGDNVAAGEVDSTGFDLSLYGNLSDQWSFIFNASQVAVEQTIPETRIIDNFEGAGLTYSMWNKYRFIEGNMKGLSLGFGFIYTDEWDGQDGLVFGDYYVFDAAIRYDFALKDKSQVFTALNVKNLTDENDKGGGPYLPGRQVLFSVGLRY